MCQGLPCVGARVRINRSLLFEGVRVPRGVEGIVEEELRESRELRVRVKFEGKMRSIQLGEYDVEIVQRSTRR